MARIRKTRATEVRATTERKAQKRTMPPPSYTGRFYIDKDTIPPGMEYRWVAIEVMGQTVAEKWNIRSAGGWKPVPRSRHLDRFPYIPMPGSSGDAYKDIIVAGGQILMEIDKEAYEAGREELRRRNLENEEAIAWTGTENFDRATPKTDFGSRVAIERVTSTRTAEFKD